MVSPSELNHRTDLYCARHAQRRVRRLGFGLDGVVWEVLDNQNRSSAVKVHERRRSYEAERNAYLRLSEHEVTEILGHQVPVMLRHDDLLLAIEMTIVTAPYVLDFGKCTLDWPPDFPQEVMQAWRHDQAKQFGDHWTTTAAIMAEIANRYGIFLTDVNPGNIGFSE